MNKSDGEENISVRQNKKQSEDDSFSENGKNDESKSRDPLCELQIQIEEKDRKLGEYYEQLLRLQAEFDNYRKRVEKEKETHRLWGKEEILLKQISLYDIIAQALESVKKTKNIDSFIVGLEMIYKEFGKMLITEGVTAIPVDRKYDPNLHEVVETVEDEAKEEDSIVSVIQNGYVMNERIIRPSRVRISKKTKKESEK